MANKQRFRRGHAQTAVGKIKAGTKAEIGSLMYQSPLDNYWYPFSSILADGTGPGFAAGTALANAKSAFVGVLQEGATSGNETVDADAVCYYGAVFEYDLSVAAAANRPPGYGLTAYVDGATLSNSKLALAAALTDAIGTVERFVRQGDLTAYGKLTSSVMGTPLA